MGAIKTLHRRLARAFGDAPGPLVWVGDLSRLGSDYDYFFVWIYDTAWPMKGWTPKGWQLAKAGVCQTAMQEERGAALASTAGGSAAYQRYAFIHDRNLQVLYLGDLAYLHGSVCGGVPYQVQVFHGAGFGEQALPVQQLPPAPTIPPPPLPGPPPTPAPPKPPAPKPVLSSLSPTALGIIAAALVIGVIVYASEVRL